MMLFCKELAESHAQNAAPECHRSSLELELDNQILIKPFDHEHDQQVW